MTTPVVAAPVPAVIRDGDVFVKVSLNGGAPVWMGLDSGAVPSIIDIDYARRASLDLKPQSESGKGFGSNEFQVFSTRANLTAGEERRDHMAFSAITFTPVNGPDGVPVAGYLGYSFLAGHIAVIDYAKGTLAFVDRLPACDCDIPVRFENNILVAPVMIGGKLMDALVDTGGVYELLVTPKAAGSLGLADAMAAAQPINGAGLTGPQAGRLGTSADLTIGRVKVTSPQTLYSTFGTAQFRAGAAIGKGLLRRYKVTLDYRHHAIRLES